MSEFANAWIELYDDLRSRVKSGELRAEHELRRADVAPQAGPQDFDRAVRRLADEGILKRDEREQYVVAAVRARSTRTASFQADYQSKGRTPSVRTLHLGLVPIDDAPAIVQNALGDANCAMLVRHQHIQQVDGVPHAIADSFVPYELVHQRWKEMKLGQYDLFRLLSEQGLEITEKQETLYVDAPTLAEREHLAMLSMPGLPVIRLNCVVWSGPTLVEVCLLCDRADLYEFTYRIRV